VPSGRDFEGIKDPKRTVEKVCRTYAGRCDQVLDLLRATVVADDLKQMYEVVRLLTDTGEYNPGRIQKANGDGTYDVLFDSGRCDSAVPRSRIREVGGSDDTTVGGSSRGDGDEVEVGDKVEARDKKFDDRVTVHRIKNKFDDAAEVRGGFRNIHFNLTLKHPTCCGSSTCCGTGGTGFVCELQIQHRKVSSVAQCTCRVLLWQKPADSRADVRAGLRLSYAGGCVVLCVPQMWEAERVSGADGRDAHSRYIQFRNGRAE
jgi:hypothetical protein